MSRAKLQAALALLLFLYLADCAKLPPKPPKPSPPPKPFPPPPPPPPTKSPKLPKPPPAQKPNPPPPPSPRSNVSRSPPPQVQSPPSPPGLVLPLPTSSPPPLRSLPSPVPLQSPPSKTQPMAPWPPLAAVLFSPPPSPAAPPAPPDLRSNNGVRLVGGSGPRGTLEISSKDAWIAGTKAVGWRPVCDDIYFDDGMAEVMCKVLGYSYGRQYFAPNVNYRPPDPNATRTSGPVGYMSCYANAKHRRSLVGMANAGTGVVPLETSGGGRGRALLAPLRGTVNIPRKGGYTCSFRLGDCDFTGPLAGVECSHTPLPPAPPPSPPPTRPPRPIDPPPSPPNAVPPPPASRSGTIKLVGGRLGAPDSVEPNICENPDGSPCLYGRVELQVADPSNPGALTWAPLCASSDSITYSVAKVLCQQVEEWPESYPGVVWYMSPSWPDTAYAIPDASASREGEFNASGYKAWVTVTGGNFAGAKRVQDLSLQVSRSKCADGNLFTVYCSVLIA